MKHRLQTHSDIDLFEINFNDKKVIDSALDAPIKCGFEAETLWPFMRIKPGTGWDTVKTLLSNSNVEKIQNRYRDWLEDTSAMKKEVESQLWDLLDDKINDEVYTNEFFDQLDEKALQQFREFRAEKYDLYKQKNLPGTDDPEWWKGTFIRVRMDREFGQWMREKIDGTDEMKEIRELAFRYLSSEDMTIDYWVEQHYANWAEALEYFDIGIDGTNVISMDPINTIAQEVKKWVKDNSKYPDVVHGGYHSGRGLDNDFWRVENDSSIKPDSKKQSEAEIVSPVYNSPRQMLAEMKKLFEFFDKSDVETNSTTGLHVTMSWFSDETTTGTNKLKMAVLLGDQYLLQQFQRLGNTYTKSQMATLKKVAELVKNDNNTGQDWDNLETFFKNNISMDKMSSINFKNLTNTMGHELIEFRIAGNRDYEKDFKKVIKAVTRYAAVMQAGHNDDLYNQDYIKAVVKLFTTSPRELAIPKSDLEFSQQIVDWESVNPNVLSAFQEVSNRKYYTDITEILSSAYKLMKIAQRRRAESENNITEDADYTWEDFFKTARSNFVESVFLIVLMLTQKSNRAPIKAKQVSAFRQAVKDFEFTPEELWNALQKIPRYISISGDQFEKSKLFAQAFNTLLKMDAAEPIKPKFVVTFNPRNETIFLHPKLLGFLQSSTTFPSNVQDFLTKQGQFDDPVKLRSMIGILTKKQYFDILNDVKDFEDVILEINNLKNVVLPSHRQNLLNSTTEQDRKVTQSLIDTTETVLQNNINFFNDTVKKIKSFILEHGFVPSIYAVVDAIEEIANSGILPSFKMPSSDTFWERISLSDNEKAKLANMGVKIKIDINASKQFSELSLTEQESVPCMKTKKLTAEIKKINQEIPVIKKDLDLFEINFNDQAVINSALNAPIRCGFEAETVWPNITPADDDNSGSWLDDLNWNRVSDLVYEQEGPSALRSLEESFNEWMLEYILPEYQDQVTEELVNERKEDERYLNDFVSDYVDEDEVEEYKAERLEYLQDEKNTLLARAKAEQDEVGELSEPKLVQRYINNAEKTQDEIDARQDWEYDAWAREYVEEEKQDEFEEWLTEQIRDNSEEWDEAWHRALRDNDVDDWVKKEYGNNWQNLLSDHEIFLVNPNSGQGREAIADIIERWAAENSITSEVRFGDYHSGESLDNDYWRVEKDPTIQGEGTDAEIISPVYDTPAEMLQEMRKLFDFMHDEHMVDTNSSTGLHVTMSYAGTDDATTNKLKMAVLLGDHYVLKQFNRQENIFTKSREAALKSRVKLLKNDLTDKKSLKDIEEILTQTLSGDKYNSINFKNSKNEYGNELCEFRIAGGNNYHTKPDNVIRKTVARYAVIMQAGHDPDLYVKDYATALLRLVSGKDTVHKSKVKSAQSMFNPDITNNKVMTVFQDLISEKSYTDAVETLGLAYMLLKKNEKNNSQQQLQTENQNDDLAKAQKLFVKAFALLISDVVKNTNRAPIKSREILALRQGLKDFGISVEQLWDRVQQSNIYKNYPGGFVKRSQKFSQAFNKMLKTKHAKHHKPSATIKYNPISDIIFMPADIEKWLRPLASSKENVPEELTPDMFMVIPTNDYQQVIRAVERISRTKAEYNNELEIVDSLTKEIENLQAGKLTAQGLDQADEDRLELYQDNLVRNRNYVKQLKNAIDQHTDTIESFEAAYGFFPQPGDLSEQPWRPLSGSEIDWLLDNRNIIIDSDIDIQEKNVFEHFDSLPLAEQLTLISKVDKQKLDEAWSKKYKRSINCDNPKGFSQKAHCAGKKKSANEGDVSRSLDRRRAQKGRDKYHKIDVDIPVHPSGREYDSFVVKPISDNVGRIVGIIDGEHYELPSTAHLELAHALVDAYNRGGFTDLDMRKVPLKTDEAAELDSPKYTVKQLAHLHGVDQQKIRDQLALGMKTELEHTSDPDVAKKIAMDHIAENPNYYTNMIFVESVPDNSTDRELQKLLCDHFPVGDLDKQMDAYLVVPVPEMLDAFKRLHSQFGPDACARDIVRHYAQQYYAQPVNEAKVIDVSKSFVTAKGMDSEFRKSKKHSKLMSGSVLGKYPARLANVSGKSYTLFVMDQEDKQPIMYFELYHLGFAYIVEIARLRKQFQGQGLGKKIYASLIKDLGMTLVSDEHQSPGAKKVWASLAKTPGINTYAWISQQGFRKAKFMPLDVDDFDQLETADGYAYFDRDDIDLLKVEMEKELRAADSREQRKQISKKYKDEIKNMFDAIPVRIVATPQRGLSNSSGKAK